MPAMPMPRPTSSRSRGSSCCNRGDGSRAECGSVPGSGRTRRLRSNPSRTSDGGGFYVFNYGYSARTDERGRFAFERVIPGPGTVSRVIRTEFAGGSSVMHMPCWLEPVEVKPGQTARVTIGGKGRPVIGRVVLDGIPEAPVDWTQNEPATITTPRRGRAARDVVRRFGSKIDKDGRFRIEDVTPGPLRAGVSTSIRPPTRSSAARGPGSAV